MYPNPTAKLLAEEAKSMDKYEYELVMLAARLKVLDFELFRDLIHPELNKFFFDPSKKDRSVEEIKPYFNEFKAVDMVALDCYIAYYITTDYDEVLYGLA